MLWLGTELLLTVPSDQNAEQLRINSRTSKEVSPAVSSANSYTIQIHLILWIVIDYINGPKHLCKKVDRVVLAKRQSRL